MKKTESRRIVPAGVMALFIFVLMLLFQVFVIAGFYGVKAVSVKRVLPAAYEPFLKMVGEHPETRPEWSAVAQADAERNESTGVTFAGFDPKEIPVTIEEKQEPEEKVLLAPTKPEAEEKAEEESAPDSSEAVPVG